MTSDRDTNEDHGAFKHATILQLEEGLEKIQHCLKQLNQEQIWWRPRPEMNSIANLLLHLCGNMRQWLISGLAETEDDRQRQNEFDDRSGAPVSQLMAGLSRTIDEAKSTISALSAEQLHRERRVQEFDFDGFRTIQDSLCHFRGHVQEIIHMTRCLKGDSYQFLFVPKEQRE